MKETLLASALDQARAKKARKLGAKFTYKISDTGEAVPLFEAEYDMSFTVRKRHKKGAVIGDPENCIEAKALCDLPNVESAYVGSGKDAYVIFGPTPSRPFKHAVHFMIPVKSARVRDAFETRKAVSSQILLLKAPKKSQTRERRKQMNDDRRAKIKNGAPVAARGPIRNTRVVRLGVAHRPKAKIQNGIVSLSI